MVINSVNISHLSVWAFRELKQKNQDYFLKYCLFIKLGELYWSGLVPLT